MNSGELDLFNGYNEVEVNVVAGRNDYALK